MDENATQTCPYCKETIKADAVRCRHCGSFLAPRAIAREWYRDPANGKIAGVCAGLSRQLGISVTLLRLAFGIGIFMGGWGLLIYLILWIVMPERPPD